MQNTSARACDDRLSCVQRPYMGSIVRMNPKRPPKFRDV